MKFLVVTFFAVISLSSCKNDLKEHFGREGFFTMRPAYLGEMPQGDDSYSQGVRDGCNTAIAIVGAGPMATSYESSYFDYDRIITDNDYHRGTQMGFNYCTYFQDFDPL